MCARHNLLPAASRLLVLQVLLWDNVRARARFRAYVQIETPVHPTLTSWYRIGADVCLDARSD